MLGGEQSGHIEAVGFEMYTTMLEEAVRALKGEDEKPAHPATVLNLGVSVRIDADYIPEEGQRLRMYKRIAGAADMATLDDVRAELKDRYGDPREAVEHLLTAARLRLDSERLGIAQIDRKRAQIEIGKQKSFVDLLHVKFGEKLSEGHGIDPGVLMKLVSRNAKRGAQFTPQGVLRWPLTSGKPEDVLRETRELLQTLGGTA
jgi:transcription-repair coupling factor (superfamily II helicase)